MSPAEQGVVRLYQQLLAAWNARDAAAFAGAFAADAMVIGFDGTQMNGRDEVLATMQQLFNERPTGMYVSIIREVRPLNETTWMLRSVAGMIPAGKNGINPDVNAVQVIIAQRMDDTLKLQLLQNTPAAYHGRPQDKEALTRELTAAIHSQAQAQ